MRVGGRENLTMSASSVARRLGERIFAAGDQEWFASASGDRNPMHVDAVAARRLLSGRQVVHGIHTLLSALELWRRDGVDFPGWPVSVQCEFNHPVNLGDAVVFNRLDDVSGRSIIEATVDGLRCTHVLVDTTLPDIATAGFAELAAGAQRLEPSAAPFDEPLAEQSGRRFALAVRNAEEFAARFPATAAAMQPQRVAAVAALSRCVGMVCPGLHSVFTSVRFAPGRPEDEGAELSFFVAKFDPRFRLFVIHFDGCIRGEIRAFVRPPPQAQPSMDAVAKRVGAGEFAGTRTLVVGGSRGLGETVAKILAAGQGDVIVSHAAGAADANRVAGEIAAFGRGRCTAVKLDLGVDRFAAFGIDPASLDDVYFFATPRIGRKKHAVFDRDVFAELTEFYVESFAELCLWLNEGARGRRINVYLPSTVFIAERPPGMTEYAMAKSAAEILSHDLNDALKNVNIVCGRLPRLATDQTASIKGLDTESNIDVLLAVVRQMNSRTATG